ncbi:MAG: NAD(+)/NADH kinase [Nitrososphaerales archaeon]
MVTLHMTDVERSVAILARKESTSIRDVAVALIEKLSSAGFRVYSGTSLKYGSAERAITIKDLKGLSPEIVVTVGGDGSLLWVLREMNDATPVLGVNVGGRGILSEVRPENVDEAVEKLRDERYLIEERMRISASIGATALPPALNEVYLNRVSETRTSTYSISIGGYTVKQRMDGLMVSTPTGSTGHSMSFGGPFIHPDTSVFLLMPVGSINRLPPIIVPAEPVEVVSDHDSVLAIDGQEEVVVKASEKVVIKKHERDARFIRFKDKRLRQLENLGF